jgi:transglutaminase-like putative cysteine protease
MVGATTPDHTAAAAWAQKQGVCQDHAQIFIACARRLGIPARYVSGHLHRRDGVIDQDAAHAWAEAHVEGLGWVGFDPANGVCPTEHYVRVACGLDALGATPIRGTSYGGGGERMTVALRVRHMQQTQQQQQRQGWS